MTLQPLLDAPPAIQIHVAAVLPAALLGLYMLLAEKGTRTHRALGRVWMALMVVTAVSSFFIHEFGLFYGFSPIHLLSIGTLFGAWQAVAAARRRDIKLHRRIVTAVYLGGIVGAGLFTLLPGRLMHQVIFPDSYLPAVALALCGALVIATMTLRRSARGTSR